jgi:hypothetical protein
LSIINNECNCSFNRYMRFYMLQHIAARGSRGQVPLPIYITDFDKDYGCF